MGDDGREKEGRPSTSCPLCLAQPASQPQGDFPLPDFRVDESRGPGSVEPASKERPCGKRKGPGGGVKGATCKG